MNKISFSDRSALIRLASSLPQGTEERRAILAGLTKVGMYFTSQKALDHYLKAHPDADRSKHSVAKKERPELDKSHPEHDERVSKGKDAEKTLDGIANAAKGHEHMKGWDHEDENEVDTATSRDKDNKLKHHGPDQVSRKFLAPHGGKESDNAKHVGKFLEKEGWKKKPAPKGKGEKPIPAYEKDGKEVGVHAFGNEVTVHHHIELDKK